MNFTINPDFEKLIPPLSQDERAGLEALILADGIQSPLIIARYPSAGGEEILQLADGHNRYRIAEKHGLKYNTITQDFASEDDVVIWMVDNQKGRRNLTDFVKLELAEVKADRLRKKGREKQKETLGGYKHQSVLSIIDKTENDNPHNTQREIAADLGWSTGKVAMAQKVMNTAPEEIKEQLRAGEVSINQAYKEVKKVEIQKRRDEIKEQLQEQQLQPGDKKYRIVYADPPWKYGNAMPEYVTEPQDYYLLMDTADICAMPVKDICEKDAVLFLWSTSPHLPEALQVVKAWGFEYKTTFIWDKIKHNMGHYNSVRHEILLVCTRGACTPDVKKLFDSVVSIERGEHSKKPEYFREIIETLYTYGNKIELFAREAPEGWDVFGNQTNKE
jgi:site-specific DNA-methyltransferase (adenine-specific)